MSDSLRQSYDRVAETYAREIAGELAGKPFDRVLLERFAARVRGAGPVWELGCGPGHVAAYLRERQVDMTGVDLSLGMLAAGQQRFTSLPMLCADMQHLPAASGSLSGLVAMYSIIHTPEGQLKKLLRECLRVLRPGAPLLVAFHMGAQTLHLESWWEMPVNVDFYFFDARIVNESLRAAGFVLDEHHEREPYVGVEHASRRAYILAARGD